MSENVSMERYREEQLPARQQEFSAEDIRLLRESICPDLTDGELSFFLRVCQARRLNPIVGQIYAIKRSPRRGEEKKLTIQTSIDGFRLIAERTGRYAPGREPTFSYDKNGRLQTATSYVKKLVAGEWHECGMNARWEEYCQTYSDGNPMGLWGKMPHVMLAKVSEAACLRRAFPEDLMGLYTDDEMAQADNPAVERRARVERAVQRAERTPYAEATVKPPALPKPQTREEIQARMAVALDAAGQLGMWDEDQGIGMDRWLDYDLDGADTAQIEEDCLALEEAIGRRRRSLGQQEASEGQERGAMVCSNPDCRKALTENQRALSTKKYGVALCPQHQKTHEI